MDLNELRNYRQIIQPHIQNHRILFNGQLNQQMSHPGMPAGSQPPPPGPQPPQQQQQDQRPGHPIPQHGSPALDTVSGKPQHVAAPRPPSAQQGSVMATPTMPATAV